MHIQAPVIFLLFFLGIDLLGALSWCIFLLELAPEVVTETGCSDVARML